MFIVDSGVRFLGYSRYRSKVGLGIVASGVELGWDIHIVDSGLRLGWNIHSRHWSKFRLGNK